MMPACWIERVSKSVRVWTDPWKNIASLSCENMWAIFVASIRDMPCALQRGKLFVLRGSFEAAVLKTFRFTARRRGHLVNFSCFACGSNPQCWKRCVLPQDVGATRWTPRVLRVFRSNSAENIAFSCKTLGPRGELVVFCVCFLVTALKTMCFPVRCV